MTASHFRIGWIAFKAHWRVCVLSMLVLFGSWVTLELSVIAVRRWAVINVFLHLAFLVVLSGLMVGLHGIAMDIVDGKTPRLKRLGATLGQGPGFLLASCLYLVAVLGGLILLVVPGVYVAVRYALFAQVLATRRTSALEALREAGNLSHGRWGAMGRFVVAALALNLAGAALLGVGVIVSFPVSLLAASSLFRTLQRSPVTLASTERGRWSGGKRAFAE